MIHTLASMCKKVYSQDCTYETWECVASSPTVLIFQKDKLRVIAIRGTKINDQTDLSAAASVGLNKLSSTNRFRSDKEFIKKHYKPIKTIGTGHSLGGAICDILLAEKLIHSATTFNPAVEPKYLDNNYNTRYYNKNDFIYKLIGRFASNVKIWDEKPFNVIDHLLDYSIIYKTLSDHSIDQFIDPEKEKHHIVQSVILHKSMFPTIEEARDWTAIHGYRTSQSDETPNEYRFRQASPELLKTGKYMERTIKLGEKGYLGILYPT